MRHDLDAPCAPEARSSANSAAYGIWLGTTAVLFWSFGSSLVYFGARQAGTWLFVAVSATTGGLLQMISRRASKGELRTALRLPWRLWTVPLVFFVTYGLVWPWALALSTPREVVAINLLNYLWPILTVVFSACFVPGVQLTWRTMAALCLAMAGLCAANYSGLRQLCSAHWAKNASAVTDVLPYLLALLAAVTWAAYSAVLVRWRSWAHEYVTSPLGFLIIGVVAAVFSLSSPGGNKALTPAAMFFTLLYGAGPLAAGYLLWELGLPKARVQTLSLVAAATPVLSTLWLCCFLRQLPGPEIITAALLVAGGILVSARGKESGGGSLT